MPASEAAPGGATTLAGVIGWPVDHSLSPAMHNAAYRAMGLDWTYVALPVAPGNLARALGGLAALGFVGANVTMPHKTECSVLVDDLSDDARRLQAVNTVVVTGDRLVGHNTDTPGFERFLREDAAFDAAGKRVLVYGAGGAARACALAVARAGAAEIVVAVRSPARALPLVRSLEDLPVEVRALASMADATGVDADLVVNATPLGARGEELPEPSMGPGTLVVDLLYHVTTTPLRVHARAAGAAAVGGLGLLLHQAALSFELWTGRQPPLETMSAAAVAALGIELGTE
jgi:shikimate dehydrogenase